MAVAVEPWGLTPLTTEGLANLGHPLSLSDFNQDASGRYWRMIRGQKTYYPREWFDASGTFTGSGTQSGDRAGQDKGFFKQGMKWNWQTGQWENPTNWANVIGVAAAGGVGAGIAAPAIGAALGGGGGVSGGGLTATEAGITTVPQAVAAGIPVEIAGGAGTGAAVTGGVATGAAPFVGMFGTESPQPYAPPFGGANTLPSTPTPSGTTPTVTPNGTTANVPGGPASTGGGTPSWLTQTFGSGPGIAALANVFGNIYAANKQAGASADALAQQQKQFDEAIAVAKEEQTYTRNQYGDYLGRLAPYNQAGLEANAREAQYMAQPSAAGGFPARSGVPPPTPLAGSGPAADVVPPVRPPGGTTPPATNSTNPTPTGTTRMQGPDGSQQDVPNDQVQHYLDLGGTVIGNRYRALGT
jgi:hypothetical protein